MISIAMTTGNIYGHIVIQNTSRCDFGTMPGRVSQIATLDGGCVITHAGVAHGDRSFSLDVDLTETDETRLKYIYQNSTEVMVSIKEGLFLGAISHLNCNQGRCKATILIKSKETS